jgi:hypothetical protein
MKTYIHIGYPKNASTTLQTDIFPNVENALYVGRAYNSKHTFISKELSDAIYKITMTDSIDFSFERAKDQINKTIDEFIGDNDKVIISSEGFANNFADRGLMAKRLNKLFPDAKILVVIRNQVDALLSMYAFLVCQRGENVNVSYGRPSVASFEKWILEQELFIGRSFITTLKYSEFIAEYQRLFGKENVTVLLFEELVNSPATFFEKIADYLDVDDIKKKTDTSVPKRNPKPTNRRLLYYKFRNRFPNIMLSKYIPSIALKWWRNYLNNGSSKRRFDELPVEMQKRLKLMYREDNRMLQKLLDVNLDKYGYEI